MGLSPEERQALDEIAKRLASDDPRLHAVLSRARNSGPGPRPSSPTASSLLQVWLMLALMTCAIFMMGMVLLLTAGGRGCASTQASSCADPTATAER
ncbi:DUF3040 domain-containing protein [Nonomuraea sp. 10N515B]|uniref:DUF3040 domain-containing protein n=1 Tax=Nonomuraea sp. 10N515B TaxID=3457422 RepID=UPI003FCC6065